MSKTSRHNKENKERKIRQHVRIEKSEMNSFDGRIKGHALSRRSRGKIPENPHPVPMPPISSNPSTEGNGKR